MTNRIKIVPWESDASGDASVGIDIDYNGMNIVSVQTIPGLNGDRTTTTPTADYDVVINDEYGEDIMEGELADRSATVGETLYANPPLPVPGILTIVVSNAGNAKTGIVKIMFDRNY